MDRKYPIWRKYRQIKFSGVVDNPQLTGNGLTNPQDILVVGSQVWVTNQQASIISRFNLDGTSAGTPLKGNGLCWLSYMTARNGVVLPG